MRRFSRLLSLLDRRKASKYHSDPSESVAACSDAVSGGFHDTYLDALAAQIEPVLPIQRVFDELWQHQVSERSAAREEYVPPTGAALEAIIDALWRAGLIIEDRTIQSPFVGDFARALHAQGYVIVPSLAEGRWADLECSLGGTD